MNKFSFVPCNCAISCLCRPLHHQRERVTDILSRSPPQRSEPTELEEDIQGYLRLVASSVPVAALTWQLITEEQERDPVCQALINLTGKGWPVCRDVGLNLTFFFFFIVTHWLCSHVYMDDIDRNGLLMPMFISILLLNYCMLFLLTAMGRGLAASSEGFLAFFCCSPPDICMTHVCLK